MSFEKMKEPELRLVADSFGVDLQNVNGKNDVLAVLAAEGVTFEQYQAFKDAAEAERLAAEALENGDPVEVVTETTVTEKTTVAPVGRKRERRPNEVLVKMVRGNFHYEIFGKTFTKEHPFVVMTEEEAQKIFDTEDGFVLAQPREAAEYYS